jgi:hypothetical protein
MYFRLTYIKSAILRCPRFPYEGQDMTSKYKQSMIKYRSSILIPPQSPYGGDSKINTGWYTRHCVLFADDFLRGIKVYIYHCDQVPLTKPIIISLPTCVTLGDLTSHFVGSHTVMQQRWTLEALCTGSDIAWNDVTIWMFNPVFYRQPSIILVVYVWSYPLRDLSDCQTPYKHALQCLRHQMTDESGPELLLIKYLIAVLQHFVHSCTLYILRKPLCV